MGLVGWQETPSPLVLSPRGVWVDHSIFASLWGVLDEAVVHS